MGKINFLSLEAGSSVSKLFYLQLPPNRLQLSNPISSELNLRVYSVLLFCGFSRFNSSIIVQINRF